MANAIQWRQIYKNMQNRISGRNQLRPYMHFSLMLCLLAFLLAACNLGGGPQAQKLVKAPASKQVFIDPQVGVTDLTTLDPAQVLTGDQASLNAIQMIYTGLVQLNDNLQIVPQLAQSWDVSSNGTLYTFHLRHNLKFSDGTPITSADVAYSIDRALQPTTKSPVAPIYLSLIKDSDKLLAGYIPTLINDSISTPDPYTITIQITKQAPYFLDMLAYPCSFVVEKSLIQQYPASFTDHLTQGGSSGPFKVSSYIHGQEIDFVPNPDYYGPRPQLRKVEFPFDPQPAVAYNAYMKGQVDTASVPVAQFAADKNRSDFHEVPQLWINYYAMNYLTKPFDNIAIRQAFALAINKTSLAQTAWKGTVLPTNHIVPQGLPGYNPNLTGPDDTPGLSGDAAKARTLLQAGLKAEGWSSVSQLPPIQLTYASGSANVQQEVMMMIGMWKKTLGVTVTPNPVDYNTLLSQVSLATNNPNGLQFWGLSWLAEYASPQDFLTRQFDSGSPNNNMNYGQNTSSDVAQQQLLQQQLENADGNPNTSAQLHAYQQAEQQLVNDVAWMPVEQETLVFLRKPTVVGIADNADDIIPPNDWSHIYIAEYA
jgi:oligopeptide transport system substrate-binding protein